MTRRGTIERSLEERLLQLDSEQIPRLEEAASTDDHPAAALLVSARRERGEILEALERARAAGRGPWDDERIEVGDTVELLEDGQADPARYVLVWETGSRVSDAWISHRSPVGRSLIGRRRGDVVVVDAPGGRMSFRIVDFVRSR
jgi:transcription elongation GreA/GreB family factor